MMRDLTLGLAGCVALFSLGACSTYGDLFAPEQPACEPTTRQTYAVRLRVIDNVTVVGVVRASASDSRCGPPTMAAQRITMKTLCLASDGQSLAIGWDEAKGRGAGIVSPERLAGCLK